MGMLIDGQWVTVPVTSGARGDSDGSFKRRASRFRHRIGAGGEHPPEPNRYHLYVSWACPWAHRTLIVRRLKHLEESVGVSVVDYLMDDEGWAFRDVPGAIPDTVNHANYLREIYLIADPQITSKVTVPVLWDKVTRTIVNNESRDIIEMFDRELGAPGTIELYPDAQKAAIDAMIDANYEAVNNGVYKAGFASTQAHYETAVTALFERLDALEAHLAKQRYLVGDQLTLADWCLFTTLLRFDAVYVGHFKCNIRRIADYPHLSGYLRDLYQYPGVAELCRFDHIKGHYYRSHRTINPTGIVPVGPAQDLTAPSGREHLGPAHGPASVLHGAA